MIRYRYTNLDPEPVNVTRIGTDGFWHHRSWHWGDVWRRMPCRDTTNYHPMGSSRKERRERRKWWGPSTRRQNRAIRSTIRAGRLCHDGHYHWFNEDKHRGWESLRGAKLRFNLDAYKRMHSMYRRTWKKRK